MTKVYAGNVVFESMEDYLAAMKAWEELCGLPAQRSGGQLPSRMLGHAW